MDKIARQFQTEIEEKYQEVEQLVKDYESEKILLTEEMKKARGKHNCKGKNCQRLTDEILWQGRDAF